MFIVAVALALKSAEPLQHPGVCAFVVLALAANE